MEENKIVVAAIVGGLGPPTIFDINFIYPQQSDVSFNMMYNLLLFLVAEEKEYEK